MWKRELDFGLPRPPAGYLVDTHIKGRSPPLSPSTHILISSGNTLTDTLGNPVINQMPDGVSSLSAEEGLAQCLLKRGK